MGRHLPTPQGNRILFAVSFEDALRLSDTCHFGRPISWGSALRLALKNLDAIALPTPSSRQINPPANTGILLVRCTEVVLYICISLQTLR